MNEGRGPRSLPAPFGLGPGWDRGNPRSHAHVWDRFVAAVVVGLVLFSASPAGAFETNGRHWDEMPIEYWINPSECPTLEDGSTIIDILERATGSWEDVACADIEFAFMGTTDKVWDNDDQNTIFCVSNPEDWQFGVGAAGATLWLPKPDGYTEEVDLALNAADLEWRDGGGNALEQGIMDPQAMITHELGHWLGLAHTPHPYGTMYFGLLPNGIQKTLSGDDKAGVCSLYPNDVTECAGEGDCAEGHHCVDIQGITVCDEIHDPPGADCDKQHIDCEGMCWVSLYECQQVCYFTDQLTGTEGYCAPVCDPDAGIECPDGFDCTPVPQLGGHICKKGFTPIWPTGDDPPEAVEMVVEVVEEVAEDLAGTDAPTEEAIAPAEDSAPSADVAPASPGGGGGCATGHVPATSAVPFLLLALMAVLRRRSCGRGFSPDVR